jgi:beta-glucanase (GH16 family)
MQLIMKKSLLLSVFLLAYCISNAQWVLVWSDEFDSSTLDNSKWNFEIGGNGWGNNEAQYYTNSATNFNITGGEATITARAEQLGTNAYTSSKISTKGLFDVKFGKIEARIQCPMGKGIWPAFWMLGTNIDQVSWPACGEIDIIEHINNDTKINGTAHWDNVGHVYLGGISTLDATQFHVYSVEWTSASIKWYADGNLYYQLNINNGVNGTNEFQLPFYLILNLAVGGDWPGYPDATTVFPAEMKIDYVRVYKDQLEASIAENELANTTVSPNPTTGILSIQNTALTKLTNYSVFGLDGKLKQSEKLEVNQKEIDLSKLENGVYFLKLTNEFNQEIIQKISIQ